MASEPGWELYRTFLAVVRERSLSGAARSLRLTQPTVGRHVDLLEQALGVPLFTRSRVGLTPAQAALELVPHVEAMAHAASAVQRTASGEAGEERGAVRVTASEMIGAEVLPVALAEFRERHPRIAVELVLSNRAQDLSRREADVAVRMVKPNQSALVARKVGTLALGFCATPRYLQVHGTPRTVDELGVHPLIGFDRGPSVSRLPPMPIPLTRDTFAFRSDSDLAQYAAIRAGFGIGVCQLALAKRDGLVEVLRGALDLKLGVWIVMHKDSRANRRVRLMFEHLGVHLKAHVAREG